MTKPCFFYFLMLCLTATGCRQSGNDRKIQVALLKGPSAIAFIHLTDSVYTVNGKQIEVSIYDNPLQIQALMAQKKVDICTLPIALAANLYNKTGDYPLLGIPVWGSLFLLENQETTSEKDTAGIFLFGQGTTPDILTRYILSGNNSPNKYTYHYQFESAAALAQALTSGNIGKAVLPEPFATLVQEKNRNIRILCDLSAAWNPDKENRTAGFAQTAVVARRNLLNDNPEIEDSINQLLKTITDRLISEPSASAALLVKHKLIPHPRLSDKIIDRCKIRYRDARESKQDVEEILKLLFQQEPKTIGNKLPDNSFYLSLE